ncbi:hypothetical protein RB195_019484 [Necator americanus]|uniref:Uncharacterized protein n=1 Tax=Necator americanus TaxID=51031 RepID=A0ABR1CFA7_NECAM
MGVAQLVRSSAVTAILMVRNCLGAYQVFPFFGVDRIVFDSMRKHAYEEMRRNVAPGVSSTEATIETVRHNANTCSSGDMGVLRRDREGRGTMRGNRYKLAAEIENCLKKFRVKKAPLQEVLLERIQALERHDFSEAQRAKDIFERTMDSALQDREFEKFLSEQEVFSPDIRKYTKNLCDVIP